jgi:hypothetical protein
MLRESANGMIALVWSTPDSQRLQIASTGVVADRCLWQTIPADEWLAFHHKPDLFPAEPDHIRLPPFSDLHCPTSEWAQRYRIPELRIVCHVFYCSCADLAPSLLNASAEMTIATDRQTALWRMLPQRSFHRTPNHFKLGEGAKGERPRDTRYKCETYFLCLPHRYDDYTWESLMRRIVLEWRTKVRPLHAVCLGASAIRWHWFSAVTASRAHVRLPAYFIQMRKALAALPLTRRRGDAHFVDNAHTSLRIRPRFSANPSLSLSQACVLDNPLRPPSLPCLLGCRG